MKFLEFLKKTWKKKAGKIILIAVVLALVTALVAISAAMSKETIDLDLMYDTLEKSSELTTIKFHHESMVDFKDTGWSFINKGNFTMKFDSQVRIGIKLEDVEINIDKISKTIWLHIPKSEVFSVEVDHDTIKFYDEKFTLFNFDEKENNNEAISQAKEETIEYVENKMGILKVADEQAEILIKGLIGELVPKGYTIKKAD